MRILVFGAGAIGSLLGHALARHGHDVILLGRQAYMEVVARQGLVLETPHERQAAHPRTITTLDALSPSAPLDLVILTVKVFDTREAVQQLAPLLSAGAPLLIVQNGVGGEEIARRIAPEATIVSAAITLVVSVLGPGEVRLDKESGGLALAPTRFGQAVQQWVELFQASGFKVIVHADYRAVKWSKLLLNILGNAVPAILDLSPGDVYRHPQLFRVEVAAFREALAVMDALQIAPVGLVGYPVPWLAALIRVVPAPWLKPLLVRLVGAGRGTKKPSLQIDLARGRADSEVVYLNGAVVSAGRQVGVPTPVNQAIVDSLIGIAQGDYSWDEFRRRPERLLTAIARAQAVR